MKPDTIYLDLDDTLVDLAGPIAELFGRSKEELIEFHSNENFGLDGITTQELWWEVAHQGPRFWADLPWLDHGKELFNTCMSTGVSVVIVTALPHDHSIQARDAAAVGKLAWIEKNLGSRFDNFAFCQTKHLLASPRKLLIDDRVSTVAGFKERGGMALEAPQPWNDGMKPRRLMRTIEFLCSEIEGVDV